MAKIVEGSSAILSITVDFRLTGVLFSSFEKNNVNIFSYEFLSLRLLTSFIDEIESRLVLRAGLAVTFS